MNPDTHDSEAVLEALGQLHGVQRRELEQLTQQARALAARGAGSRPRAEGRLMQQLFPEARGDVQGPGERRRRLAFAAAGGMLVAAAALLVLRPALVPAPASQPFDVAYRLVPPRPDASLRAASPPGSNAARSSGVFSLGRTLEIALLPATRHSGALRVDCYATQAGRLIHFQPTLERDAAGGVRVILRTGPGTQLDVQEGRWELLFYLAPASAPGVSERSVRARVCPADVRCLKLEVRFARPRAVW